MKQHVVSLFLLVTVSFYSYGMYAAKYGQLESAMWKGDLQEVHRLVMAGASIHGDGHRDQSALSKAAEWGNLDILDYLIGQRADVDEDYPLLVAVENGHQDAVNYLVECRADMGATNENGSLLENAFALKGPCVVPAKQLGMITHLLKNHGDHINNIQRNNALLKVSKEKHEMGADICAELLRYRANVHIQDEQEKSPLHYALEAKNSKVARVLIGANALLDRPDKSGVCPLHIAAGQQDVDMCKLLVALGASFCRLTKARNTPLHYAANNHVAPAYDYLVEQGADPHTPNHNNVTPHQKLSPYLSEEAVWVVAAGASRGRWYSPEEIADREQRALEKLKVLVARGALLNRPSEQTRFGIEFQRQPLDAAVCYGLYNIAEWLLENNADPNAPSGTHGERPLARAAQLNEMGNHIEMAHLLLRYNADVESPDKREQTALMEACEFGHEPMVQLLLGRGADPHRREKGFNKTALWLATKGKHGSIMRMLLALNVDPDVQTGDGETPLHRARRDEFREGEELLLAAKADSDRQIN